MHSPIDLSFLERFCHGDRARMAKYIALYLAEAPALFAQLHQVAVDGDAAQVAATAHSLRPMAHQMGAPGLMAALTSAEERAKTEGPEAWGALVAEVQQHATAVDAQLRTALVRLTGN